MRRYAFATVVLVLVAFPWRQTPQADSAAYTVEPLGNLAPIGGLLPAETGINASGEVVGTVSDNSLGTRAVRYTDANGWEYVPGLTWGSTAAAVNVHGDIVGTLRVNSQSHAYRYNAASNTVDDIGLLPNGDFSEALAVNDNGDVAGDGTTNGLQLAFVASRGHLPVILPNPGGGFAQPCGINNAGQVAMTVITAQGLIHAARLETDNTYTDAGTLDSNPAGFSLCSGMDQLGNVGGETSANNSTTFPGYRFDGTTMINVLTGLPGTTGNIQALANGNAAGWFNSTVDGVSHAMLYTDANGAVDLNQQIPSGSGWLLTQITGINASGQMVGDGMLNGTQTVFRLNPAKTKDTTPPVIAPHADVSTEATSSSGAVVSYSAPSTSDNVDPNGTAICAPASGSTFALGTTTVTCNATDAAGNVATPTTFKVVVRDTTPPVITAHSDITAEATGPKGASVTYSAPATTDAVDGNGTAVCAPGSGSTFALGATTVTCNASDAAGNAAVPTMFSVVVRDTTPPVIAAHGDVSAEATSPNGAIVSYSAPMTTDAVDGNSTATCAPASGSTFALGATTVTCNASDAAGNHAAPTAFNIVVRDTTAPVISTVYASPDAIWPPNGKMVPVSVMAIATDVVDPSPVCSLTSITGGSAGSSSITGQFSANVRSDNGAVYTLTVTCRDASGNKSCASTTIVVGKTNGNNAAPKANSKTATSVYDNDRDDRGRDVKNDRDGRKDRDDRGRDRDGRPGGGR